MKWEKIGQIFTTKNNNVLRYYRAHDVYRVHRRFETDDEDHLEEVGDFCCAFYNSFCIFVSRVTARQIPETSSFHSRFD